LTSPSPEQDEPFDTRIAIDGDTLLVGQAWAAGAGSVHVFTRSGGSWSQAKRLSARDGAADNEFGISVGLQQDLALVGARGAQVRLPMAADADHRLRDLG
jgi:hypothetical protein